MTAATRRIALALLSRLLAFGLGTAARIPPLRTSLRRRARIALQRHDLLFLCHGNLNRSAFAAALARQRWPGRRIGEAGCRASEGEPSSPLALAAAAPWGVDLIEHRAAQLCDAMLDDFSAVFVFDARNLAELALSHPRALARAHLLGWLSGRQTEPAIADPHGGPAAAYEAAFERIGEALDRSSE